MPRISLPARILALPAALLLISTAAMAIPPCPTQPLGAWFRVGEQCRTKDGRICTLIGVKANKQGIWSCRQPGR